MGRFPQIIDPNAPPKPPYVKMHSVDPRLLFGVPVRAREWVVQDWLPAKAVTLLYGDGGVGKTLLAQMLMTSTSVGVPWCGLRVEPCRSFALFCEDDEDELHRRQDAINIHFGLNFSDLEAMRWVSGVGADNVLIRFESDGAPTMTERFDDLVAQATAHGAKLVVVDTAADTFGGSENDRGQVRQFISNALGRFAKDTGAAVLLNAHPSRTGLSTGDLDGGSTGWSNSSRSRWSLARPAAEQGEIQDPNERILTRRKANYSSIGDTIKLRWNDGVLLPPSGESTWSAIGRRADIEATFMVLFENAGERPLSPSKAATNFAPAVFCMMPGRKGYTKREFHVAMESLLEQRRLGLVPYGPPSKGTIKLAVTPPEPPPETEDANTQ
jgi:RecA-family ATPase